MSDFSKTILNNMFDLNVRFAQIMHIPTLTVSIHSEVSEEFQDFLSSAVVPLQAKRLIAQCPSFKKLISLINRCVDLESDGQTIAIQMERNREDFEFLIQIECAVPYSFKFDEAGNHLSNSLGGTYYLVWILAKDMKDAAEQAIAFTTNMRQEELLKAKNNQGLI